MKNGNGNIPPGKLIIGGYDVSGTVTSDSQPINGVSFVLFSKIKSVSMLINEIPFFHLLYCTLLIFLIHISFFRYTYLAVQLAHFLDLIVMD